MRHALTLFAILLFDLGLAPRAAVETDLGPFSGEIVDLETSRPIAGAILLFVWRTPGVDPAKDPLMKLFHAQEVISDEQGYFSVPRLQTPIPDLGLQPPVVYFVAPGYLRSPYFFARRSPDSAQPPLKVDPVDGRPFVDPTVIPMRRVSSKEEWCRDRVTYLPFGIDIPHDQMPHFLETMRAEATTRGDCAIRRR